MKTNFSLTQEYVPEWNKNKSLPEKEQLVATLAMPTVEDTFDIIERLQANGVSASAAVDSTSVSFQRARSIAAEAGKYIPKYVTLKGAEDFSVEDAIKYPPYFSLAVELLFALVQFAQPNEADEKN